MHKSGQNEVIKPRRLAAWERELLIDRLYPLHCRIFTGMERSRFVQQIIGTPARETTILLRKNRHGELVGYCAVHLYDHRLGQKTIGVVRCQAGLLREYRGGNSMIPFVLRKIVWFRLCHPLRRMVFFGAMIHPSSYLLCSKYAEGLWPVAGQENHPASHALLNSCLRRFGLTPLDPAKPLVVNVGLHTRDDHDDQHYWLNCNKPAVRFFLEQNPNFLLGHGLLTLIPLSLMAMMASLGRLLCDRLMRGARRWRARLQMT